MKQTPSLNWPLIIGLGALALIRPAVRIIGWGLVAGALAYLVQRLRGAGRQ